MIVSRLWPGLSSMDDQVVVELVHLIQRVLQTKSTVGFGAREIAVVALGQEGVRVVVVRTGDAAIVRRISALSWFSVPAAARR